MAATINNLEKYNAAIKQICASHNVKSLYAFGSVLTGQFNKSSDVDLLVDFLPIDILAYGDNYFDLKFSLEEILKRPVDLLEDKAIKNPYLKQKINQHKQMIYGE